MRTRSYIFSKYELRGSPDDLTLVPRPRWLTPPAIRLHDINTVVIHRDLMVIKHDGGEACLANPHAPENLSLLQALWAIHGIHIIESDERRYLERRLSRAGGAVFMLVATALVAGVVYLLLTADGNPPQGTIFFCLGAGLVLAYLIRMSILRLGR